MDKSIRKCMMTILQINPVIRKITSTGRIAQEIGEQIIDNGGKSYIAFSAGRDSVNSLSKRREKLIERNRSTLIPIGNKISVVSHWLATRLFDQHGLSSINATKIFIEQIQEIEPDIVHLHNLHGYYINYPILFHYLKTSDIPVIWTIHDCWAFTGHCHYYSAIECEKWRTGCENCSQIHNFPSSWLIDKSAENYSKKKSVFNSLKKDKLLLIGVSQWMSSQLSQSLFSDINQMTIYNGIDIEIFSPCDSESVKKTKEKYNISHSKKIILAVANHWDQYKGIYDLLKIASNLNSSEVLVIVGKYPKIIHQNNMIFLGEIYNQRELARIYSMANVLINPTYQDNFPTVNIEALACGTPVITYNTGGSIECIDSKNGAWVKKGDFRHMLNEARKFNYKDYQIKDYCRKYAEERYNRIDRYDEYIKLYKLLVK